MKLGIPRALYYHRYIIFWQTFFENIGFEVVVSKETTKSILDLGVNSAVDGTCLPVKVYYGHIYDLMNQAVDLLFIPRIISVAKGEYICPKFMGLPDMVKSNISPLAPVLSPIIDGRKHNLKIMREFFKLGLDYASLTTVAKAYRIAQKAQQAYDQKRYLIKSDPEGLVIAVVGHEYLLHDDYISMETLKWLKKAGCQVITPEQISESNLAAEMKRFPQRMFWTAGHRSLGTAKYLLSEVDGVVALTAFACGIDSLINDFLERYCHRSKIPYLQLSLDEHTGQAGVITRLEAFTELLARRKEIEANHAAHG